jgi:hypothetical protein
MRLIAAEGAPEIVLAETKPQPPFFSDIQLITRVYGSHAFSSIA